MYFLSIYLFVPMTNALITTQIHRNSIYRPHSSCAFVGNITLSSDASIQSCIWQCVDEYNCQTAVYFKDKNICSMFSEVCEKGSIVSCENVWASVIYYRKSHEPVITCSSTATTNQEDEEKTSQLKLITTTQQDSTKTTATTTTTTSVWSSTSFWPFDNNTLDGLSSFNGETINNATYKTPGINGYGSALFVDRNKSQFVEVSSYRKLDSRSFTVEMWFYCTNLTSADHGLFGQYHYHSTDLSLHYQIRNFKLQIGFYSDDLYGSTVIQTNTWYHVAFIYDYSSSIQYIYLNGKSDGNRSSNAYQGTAGSIVIGKTEQDLGFPNYFSGYIDEVLLTMRAKTASEILDDATLVCWHSFDSDLYYDSGPLRLNGTAVNVTYVAGRVNRAITFTSNLSYYQIGGFVLLGISNYSYSIAFWVQPLSINESVLVHLSTTTNGQGWCLVLMRLSSIGQIIVTVGNNSLQQVVGPVLPVNAWTHIVNTYSTTNGFQLYINGTLNGTTGPTTYPASGQVNILTLANSLQANLGPPCVTQSTVLNVFYGSIDEFRVYSRELNITDVKELANA